MSRYRQWLEAERQAQAADHALGAAERAWDPSHPRSPAQEARRLRAVADRLFPEAMKEMHAQVQRALDRPLRKPR